VKKNVCSSVLTTGQLALVNSRLFFKINTSVT